MRKLDTIILHCTATKFDHDISVEDINIWHKARGFKMCGYHYLVKLDGTIEFGRPLDMVGAHCRGFNKHSVGIAYAGGIDENKQSSNTMNEVQEDSIFFLIESLAIVFGDLRLLGHNDLTDLKSCPNFNVGEWWVDQQKNEIR